MAATRRLATVRALLFALTLAFAGRAEALTAGTGTVTVTVNVLGSRLGISATFTDATYDLGVDLGPVGTVSATSVALHNVNLTTGASFVVPFANASNGFDAAGDIACPSGGCLAPASGPYAFVGFLQNVNVSLLPAGYTYTFDGSVTWFAPMRRRRTRGVRRPGTARAPAEPNRDSEPEVVTHFASSAPQSHAADSTHTQVSPRIGLRKPFGSAGAELHAAAFAPLNTEDAR